MDVEAIRNGDFSSIEGDWVSDSGHVVTITKSGLTKSEETGSTDGKTVIKDFKGQPMFYFADNSPGHGVNPFVPVPANQAAPSPDNSVKDTDRLVQIPELAGPGVVYTPITELGVRVRLANPIRLPFGIVIRQPSLLVTWLSLVIR